MNGTSNRLTLVVSNHSQHSWNRRDVLFIDSLSGLPETMVTQDVERIILDRSARADEFLHFLAALPGEVGADVMWVDDDGSAFLSSSSRGGGRVLYALSAADVAFYRQTNGLTEARADLALIA